jgi:RNA polymerase sigma factor (TIGR02999 family)
VASLKSFSVNDLPYLLTEKPFMARLPDSTGLPARPKAVQIRRNLLFDAAAFQRILTISSKCETLCAVRDAMGTADTTISTLIELAEKGDEDSATKLFTLLYAELHGLAKRQLARHGYISISATTLIHEAYLDMAPRGGQSFPDRGRFMAYAARVMRGLIIDHVRNRLAVKRGGRFELTALTPDITEVIDDDRELMRISQALDELARVDSSLSQIVDLKFFCGFSFGEIADMAGTSERTVQRKWEKARIYLHSSLRADLPL